MTADIDPRKTAVGQQAPPARPSHMTSTVEEILLRRPSPPPARRRSRSPRGFPPPRYPHGLFSWAAAHPWMAAAGAYCAWTFAWGYFYWYGS